MVKAYLRYELASSWGVLASNSDICYTHDGAHLVTAALENVNIWNVKRALVVETLKAPATQSGKPVGEITRLAASPVSDQIAAGHSDGTVRVWSLSSGELEATFSGHRSGISALRFSADGALLASGARDTDVVVWDVGAESGLFRLRGHSGEITALAFLPAAGALVSSSKDGLVKAWDLGTQHCFQTLTGHPGEVWSLAVSEDQRRLVTGSTDDLLRWYVVWECAGRAGEDAAPPARLALLDAGGHRADVRALALAGDDSVAVSASTAGVKVWNPRTGSCLRTVEAGYCTALLFVPGNRHVVLGTKEGQLAVVDIAAGEVQLELEAHTSTVWSLTALPDGNGFISGSGDKEVKEWVWTLEPQEDGPPRLGFKHTRTLQMTDDVMCVRVSPNGKLLAVALLDATVRIFFLDSFKFFLSLYGHKLPVLCMDISSDSTLLITGSADKNLKIWGLDFGDCHRSLFAHADSVMQAAFVPGTHYVFTAGKDGVVKYWDADKFEHLLTLAGHHGAVWAMAVSSLGDWLLTGSADRSLRRWCRTDEPFFVEEEQERRLESLFEADLEGGDDRRPVGAPAPGDEGSAAPAARRTLESVSAADAIVEALDAAAAEEAALEEWRAAARSNPSLPRPAPSPLLLGLAPDEYVLAAVRRVRGPDLESAALLLPFGDALRLLGYVAGWLRGPARGGAAAELMARLVALLLRVHLGQLSVTPAARGTLTALRDLLHARLGGAKRALGFNLAALGTLGRLVAEQGLGAAGVKRSAAVAGL
ncbi:WD repeat-containing protein 3-like protein [Auxenochlorella protothecoides]|uniref:WD repeat-containing protein 3-like protein n=1 Tax=Auxenochlorella protothecoides TaxID=3075 RepID=A0A087SKB8_AUXPR|nr:WD repeat-containing protein 3-like protein [Auxenochlorella protothecoides]KFM26172.1 WD repeat-containing protein 3-like protein [Auxenochlorella protothecoides]